MRPWFLYVIECEDGSLYAGITVDVAKRFVQHCAGKGARYTRSHPPKSVLGFCAYPDRSSASKAEYAFKQLTPVQKRQLIREWHQATP
jgi:putative endonuclease